MDTLRTVHGAPTRRGLSPDHRRALSAGLPVLLVEPEPETIVGEAEERLDDLVVRGGRLTGPLGLTKRIFDAVLASVLLIALSPLILLVAILIRLEDGGPVFYRQRRVGFGGEQFWILKFRSMEVGAESLVLDLTDRNMTDGLLFKVDADPRVTRVGGLIRRLSIDELPQLWNVVKGEMSLVGPRPLAVEPGSFGPRAGRRHMVRPGVTGYWQVSGGNRLSYERMVELDFEYIRRQSFATDLRLLLATVPAVFDRQRPA